MACAASRCSVKHKVKADAEAPTFGSENSTLARYSENTAHFEHVSHRFYDHRPKRRPREPDGGTTEPAVSRDAGAGSACLVRTGDQRPCKVSYHIGLNASRTRPHAIRLPGHLSLDRISVQFVPSRSIRSGFRLSVLPAHSFARLKQTPPKRASRPVAYHRYRRRPV